MLLTFSSLSSNFLWKFFCSLSAYRILYIHYTCSAICTCTCSTNICITSTHIHTHHFSEDFQVLLSFVAQLFHLNHMRNTSIAMYTPVSTHAYMTIHGTSVHLSCSSLCLFQFCLKFRVLQFITVQVLYLHECAVHHQHHYTSTSLACSCSPNCEYFSTCGQVRASSQITCNIYGI